MKITLIHSIYAPYRRGGAEVAVETAAAELLSQGHQVSVITVGYKTEIADSGGIRIYRIKPFNLFNFLDINEQPTVKRFFWHLIDMFSLVQIWRIAEVLKRDRPDLVIGHNLKGLGYGVPRLARILNLKYIQTIHDMQYLHPSGLLADLARPGAGARLYGFFCRALLASPDLVVFPSKFMKHIYDANGFFRHSPAAVLGNPISLNTAARAPIGPTIAMNCLYLGQVEMYKGAIDLIEAFKELRGDATLTIAGDGSAMEAAKIMAKDDKRIVFAGRLDSKELEQKIWPGIRLLINPSKVNESFGLGVLEAFAHGIPAVVSAMGALPELVVEGETGWLVPPGNKEALKNTLQEIIDRGPISENMKERCLARAMDFEVGHYLEGLMKLISIK